MRFLVGLGAAGSDIGTPAPNRRHDAQFLGNFLQRDILGKPLKGVNYGLFVRHRENSTALLRRRQASAERLARSGPLKRGPIPRQLAKAPGERPEASDLGPGRLPTTTRRNRHIEFSARPGPRESRPESV